MSGIIEAVIALISLITGQHLIFVSIDFFQLTILLFILRRFRKVKYKLTREANKEFYLFFYLFLTLNCLFIITILCLGLSVSEEEEGSEDMVEYFIFSYSVFGLLASIWLFKVGTDIRKLIISSSEVNEKSLFEKCLSKEEITIEDLAINIQVKDDKVLKEESMSLRVKQLNLVIFGYFTADLVDFLYNLLLVFVVPDMFEYHGHNKVPSNFFTVTLETVDYLANFMPVLCNYIAFFYLVKDYFNLKKKKTSSESVQTQRFSRQDSCVSKDIEDFLQ